MKPAEFMPHNRGDLSSVGNIFRACFQRRTTAEVAMLTERFGTFPPKCLFLASGTEINKPTFVRVGLEVFCCDRHTLLT
jgi:hypothetical protein